MVRWLVAAGLLWALAGCETQELHASCPLDEDVVSKRVCDGTTGTVTCVVRHHPQCDQNVCISYFSNPPICTRVCKGDVDCLSTDKCYVFATDPKTGVDEKYCVPTKLPTSKTNK